MTNNLRATDPVLIQQAIDRTEINVNRIASLESHGPDDKVAEERRLEEMKQVLSEVKNA